MELMCEIVKPYVCPICNQPTLFFINKYNKIIDYKALIDRQTTLYGLKNYVAVNNVTKLKCIECNQEYMMDWSNGYPTILSDKHKLDKFKEKKDAR
jgi:hypothetical protein